MQHILLRPDSVLLGNLSVYIQTASLKQVEEIVVCDAQRLLIGDNLKEEQSDRKCSQQEIRLMGYQLLVLLPVQYMTCFYKHPAMQVQFLHRPHGQFTQTCSPSCCPTGELFKEYIQCKKVNEVWAYKIRHIFSRISETTQAFSKKKKRNSLYPLNILSSTLCMFIRVQERICIYLQIFIEVFIHILNILCYNFFFFKFKFQSSSVMIFISSFFQF